MKKKIFSGIAATVLCIALFIVAAACTENSNKEDGNEWDNLGGGGTAVICDDADSSGTDTLSDRGKEILDNIIEEQNPEYADGTEVTGSMTISAAGDYRLSGNITGQIKITAAGVRLFLDNCNITHTKKVIDSSEDLKIVLVEGSVNTITNSTADSNAVSGSGNIIISGSGKLTINSTKSGIKADGTFYGIGGELIISAGTGHGVSADTCIINGISIEIISAAKDGIHAETDDAVLEVNPVFDDNRGYVYVGAGSVINVSNVYGDGIQADTFVLIDGGIINISTVATFIKAESSDGCYSKSGNIYNKVAAENSKNYSSLYQLQESCKGIKVGEIDYIANDIETVILTNTNYSLIIAGGTLIISTTDDGLHTNSGNVLISGGSINIKTSDDAVCSDKNLKITGGMLIVTASYEGLEGETIDISGGTIKITATDDGINASSDASTTVQKTTCYIKISGGKIYVNSSGDGVDSNGGIQVSGGELYICGPTSGADASLDSETGIIITGGIVIAAGSSGMVETPATNSTQYSVSLNLSSTTSGNIAVKSGSETLISFSPSDIFGISKNYQSIVISCPSFKNGNTYSIESGTKTTSATISSSIVTKIGTAVGPGGGRR